MNLLRYEQALRRNPYAPDVPCHCVVTTALTLGGFDGSWVRSQLITQTPHAYRGGTFLSSHCPAGCMQGNETPNVRRKRALLESEGVGFTTDGARVSAACLASEAVLVAAAGAPA